MCIVYVFRYNLLLINEKVWGERETVVPCVVVFLTAGD